MASFSDYALEKMLDLYNNHAHQVGSHLKAKEPDTYKNFEATDCITYVQQTLVYAYKKAGRADFAAKVQKDLGSNKGSGTHLAKTLVLEDNWTGVYINPDTSYKTNDKDNPWWSAKDTFKSCKYYGIPMTHAVVDYLPEPTSKSNFAKFALAVLNYWMLTTVKFGFGCSFGGDHTWLFSNGEAYEVHWSATPTGNLYQKRPLSEFTKGWKTGAIVIPPDAVKLSSIESTAQLSCP